MTRPLCTGLKTHQISPEKVKQTCRRFALETISMGSNASLHNLFLLRNLHDHHAQFFLVSQSRATLKVRTTLLHNASYKSKVKGWSICCTPLYIFGASGTAISSLTLKMPKHIECTETAGHHISMEIRSVFKNVFNTLSLFLLPSVNVNTYQACADARARAVHAKNLLCCVFSCYFYGYIMSEFFLTAR